MERFLLLSCGALLIPALAGYAAGERGQSAVRVGRAALLLSWVAATGALAARWVEAGWGHPPVADWYESILFSAWSLLGLFLATERRLASTAAAPAVIVTAATAVTAALLAPSTILPLAAPLRSRWLAFHAVTLAAAYAAFALAFALGVRSLSAAAGSPRARRRVGAAAAGALVALGSGGGNGVATALALLGLSWIALGSESRETGSALTASFHLGSWWSLLLGLALAEAGEGVSAAPLLIAGTLLSLLSLVASPLVDWWVAGRFGPWMALPVIPLVTLATMAGAEPFAWAALPLALLPAVSLLAGRRPAPRILPALLSPLILFAAVTAVGEGRGSLLLAGFLVTLLVAVPRPIEDREGPDAEAAGAAEEAASRMVLPGFLLLTAGIGSGAAWAHQAWGTYWGWDPKETWSLVIWLLYAAYLHARFHRRWAGAKAALFLVLGFVVVFFTYVGVSRLLPGLHSYL